MPTPPCRILLISGSLRAGSTNTALLRTAHAGASASIETTLYDGMGGLPHFNPDDDAEGMPVHPAVAALRAAVRAADALLLSTPEYAGALPGSFKNLLIADGEIRSGVADVLRVLARHIEIHHQVR